MENLLLIVKALSDPSRLRVICALRGRELCACDLIAMLGLAQGTVSRHMALLVGAGLVIGRRDGRWMYYRLPGDGDAVPAAAVDAVDWLVRHGARDAAVRVDARLLGKNGKGRAHVCSC